MILRNWGWKNISRYISHLFIISLLNKDIVNLFQRCQILISQKDTKFAYKMSTILTTETCILLSQYLYVNIFLILLIYILIYDSWHTVAFFSLSILHFVKLLVNFKISYSNFYCFPIISSITSLVQSHKYSELTETKFHYPALLRAGSRYLQLRHSLLLPTRQRTLSCCHVMFFGSSKQ